MFEMDDYYSQYFIAEDAFSRVDDDFVSSTDSSLSPTLNLHRLLSVDVKKIYIYLFIFYFIFFKIIIIIFFNSYYLVTIVFLL